MAAIFKRSKVPVPTEYTEFSMENLFMRRQNNQISIIDKNYGFGHTAVNNWVIFDGEDASAKVIARGQGSHINAGTWVSSFVLAFENEMFKGSTLDVMGRGFASEDWAIVGGTGQFALATGVIKQKIFEPNNGFNQQLTIQVFCPVFQAPTLTIPIPTVPAKKSKQFGGNGGKEFEIPGPPQSLLSLTIRSGDVIDSVAFSYVDQAGTKQTAGPWGGNGGLPKTIVLAPTETVTKIFGTFDNFGGNVVVTSLSFVTNVGTYGPFGKQKGTNFSIPENNTKSVVGFFGRGGQFLDAIGVYEL